MSLSGAGSVAATRNIPAQPASLLGHIIRNEKKVYVLLGLALTVLSLAVIWINRFPPLQDYPYHLVRMHMIRHFLNEDYGFADRATLSLFPTPYILADYLSLLFGQFSSVYTTGKLILSSYILLMSFSIYYLSRVVHNQFTPFGLLGFALIFNWSFNMGFLSFIFSIPFFLLAVGYWWAHRTRFTPVHLSILTGLVACVYLSHPFTFCFLFFVLLVMSIYFLRTHPRAATGLLSFIPSFLLLAFALSRDLPSSEINQTAAFYLNDFQAKLSMAFGNSLPYFTSFKPWHERFILYFSGAAILAFIGLQLFKRPGVTDSAGWGLGAASLVCAYFLLPDHLLLPNVGYVANRILIFFAFMLILLPAPPARAIIRLGVALSCFALSLAQISLMHISYRNINDEFSDLYAAIQQVPERSRLTMWSNLGLARFGNISPVALFSGYYYIERAGAEVPTITAFAGPLRSLQFKDQSDRSRTVEDILRKGCALARKGGYVVIVSESEHGSYNADEFGCTLAVSSRHLAVYRNSADAGGIAADRGMLPDSPSSRDDAYFRERYFQQSDWFEKEHEYLLFYGPEEDALSLRRMECYEPVFARNNSHIFKYDPGCPGRPPETRR